MGKSSTENQVRSLRDKLARSEADHRAQIAAKNRAIDQARSERNAELVTLMATYRNLRPLFAALVRASVLAEPGASFVPDLAASVAVRLGDDGHPEDPYLSSDGASTRWGIATLRDRNRVERFDRWLEGFAARLERDMGPREFEADRSGSPQCWEEGCEARAEFQSSDLEACRACGTPFGPYKPVDLTTPRSSRRCWTSKCPRRGRKIRGEACEECGSPGTERK